MDIARAFLAKEEIDADYQHVRASGDIEDATSIRQFAVAYLRREQDLDLHAFGISFDVYSLESALYTDGKVEATVKKLVKDACKPCGATQI